MRGILTLLVFIDSLIYLDAFLFVGIRMEVRREDGRELFAVWKSIEKWLVSDGAERRGSGGRYE